MSYLNVKDANGKINKLPLGKNGTSVTIKSITESTVSGGENVVTFSDGNTLKVKNGKDSPSGTGNTVGVADTIGTTYPPAQRSAEPKYDDCEEDMPNIHNTTADDIHAYIDNVVSGKPTVTKEIMGKDASGKYDIARYIYAKREHLAWVKENYPKMYAWKNGNAVKYTTSVAPRINDRAYDVPYIKKGGTTTETVTVPALAILYVGYRYSHSGGKFNAQAEITSLILPLPVEGVSTATVNLTGVKGSTYGGYGGTTNTTFPTTLGSGDPWTNDYQTFTVPMSGGSLSGIKFLTIPLLTQDDFSNITITLNGVAVNYKVGEPSEAKQASTTTTEVETEGDAGLPVTAVSATRRSRTIGGVEYVRYEAGDVEPTVIYTDKDDDRNSGATITKDGVTYSRYPLGDLGANRKKLLPIVIWANVHGTPKVIPDETITGESASKVVETKMCALIAARFMRDLAAEKQLNNPLYQFIRENCMVIVIPVANPYGYNCNVTDDPAPYSGYYNANGCNINRNHDTPGWDVMRNNGSESAMTMGTYPASQNETQYLDNTMVESGAVVAMSLHGGDRADKYCLHQGQNPSPDGTGYVAYNLSKLEAIEPFIKNNYGYDLRNYDYPAQLAGTVGNTPDVTSKDPSFISQCRAYGGILELAVVDPDVSGFVRAIRGKVVEAAYAQMLNFTAMWLADYLGM